VSPSPEPARESARAYAEPKRNFGRTRFSMWQESSNRIFYADVERLSDRHQMEARVTAPTYLTPEQVLSFAYA